MAKIENFAAVTYSITLIQVPDIYVDYRYLTQHGFRCKIYTKHDIFKTYSNRKEEIMRSGTPSSTLKDRISDFFSIVTEVLSDNSDGRVTGRRGMLIGGYFTNLVSCLIMGNYFTGLLLSMNADDIYISYINMATTLCGFLQFVAPLMLERMKKRKTFLMIMRCLQGA